MTPTEAFLQLQAMVQEAEARPVPRTIEDEDHMAMEELIVLNEGAVALMRYRKQWREERRRDHG